MLLAASLTAVALLYAAAGLQWLRVRRMRQAVANDLRRLVNNGAELLWLIENRDRLAEWQEVSVMAMDEGTLAVRDIHRAIANIPFGILEAIPVTRDTTRVVRSIHDLTADGVYAGVGIANRLLGKRLQSVLDYEGPAERSAPQRVDKTDEDGESG